jgi:nucleotide-binding universal stress UspA family protein
MNIVVGLDTTPAAAEALRWAARYARAVGADLHAVHAYLWSEREAVLLPTGLTLLDTSGAHPRAVQPPEDVSRLFASVQPESSWTLQCFAGDPGPLLRRRSEEADLLVVGTGEHVGLGRLLVGSVSHYCLSHAKCPVVAVPAPHLVAEVTETAEAAENIEPTALPASEST